MSDDKPLCFRELAVNLTAQSKALAVALGVPDSAEIYLALERAYLDGVQAGVNTARYEQAEGARILARLRGDS